MISQPRSLLILAESTGHKLAFEGGVLHYDISDSNILMRMCHEAGVDLKGFLNDFDQAFGWKRFLRAHGWKTDMDSWNEFVATGEGIANDEPDDPQTVRWKKRNVDLASENNPRDFVRTVSCSEILREAFD